MIEKPAYEKLMEKLKEDIISGKIPMGTRITIADIAEKYKVSSMPAREAIKSLQSEGYVEIIPRRGARVKEFNAKFVGNVYDVMGALEQMIMKSAVESLSDSQIETWIKIADKHRALFEAGKFEEVFFVNKEFHGYLFDCCGNVPGKDAYERCYTSLNVVRSRFGISRERTEQACKEHYLMAELLKMREKAAADVALNHTLRAKEYMMRRLNELSSVPVAS